MPQESAMSLLLIEVRRRIHEVDWIETPYFQMLMTETADEWMVYYDQLKAIPHKITVGELNPPEIVDGKLSWNGWPKLPSDYNSTWDQMASFSKRNNE